MEAYLVSKTHVTGDGEAGLASFKPQPEKARPYEPGGSPNRAGTGWAGAPLSATPDIDRRKRSGAAVSDTGAAGQDAIGGAGQQSVRAGNRRLPERRFGPAD